MQIEQIEVTVPTPDGQMPAFLAKPVGGDRHPAILLLMESFGLTSHIHEIAIRLANEGYVVLAPDLYYRQLLHNKFGYDEVEQAMAMMWNLDFGQPMEEDIRAALNYLKSCSQVYPERIGVTGFCLGGGLTFFTACKFSGVIAAAAPFYGMVLDEWIDAIPNITVPMYLFFGGIDLFIPLERIQQIESRFQELDKEYTLKIYPEADHGFFYHERSSYNRVAAEDSWQQLTRFLRQHLLLG
ncbi:dienelactone hydrolase family protein [Leptolyngbya sp. FACHB-541]|uniref:dienelactone hydrolase family protein n=1 Tax=Leptolyngbya sp. FACHB-541 TaxID=2692810 RepID=UPI001685E448|nr:dienelactone hydrolase family protein [Leptolyngbya sp. FACHB-541]MBD1999272.1 dienelactone hydrolase family protein [Leptolyngbya sp. FACHB-541]